MSWDNQGGAAAAYNDNSGDARAYGGGDYNGEENGGGHYNRGGNDGACYNCGEQGHSKADCPAPPKARPCYNCGEGSHTKAECTNEAVAREFTGTCRLCEEQGHRAADCPTAPPKLCNNCEEEGHMAMDCTSPRKHKWLDVIDVPADQAWAKLESASKERDMDDMRDAIFEYIKATPDATFVQLERGFRSQHLNVYLIAVEKELTSMYCNMDLQGYLNKKYTVSFRLSPNVQRPKEKDSWPATPEENIERLGDAGLPVERGVIKCNNCGELGHSSRACKEEKQEPERVIVTCFNCEGVGHRVRDCPNPRPDKFACRNCKESGHSSKDCPEPRSAEGVECKKCSEVGHFSRDCPTGGGGGACHNCGQEGHRSKECTNERILKCRNCDAEGHVSKECPKPRDYSRVQCQNCQQMGHTKVRCKEPHVDEENATINGEFGADTAKENGGYGSGNNEYGNDGNNCAEPPPAEASYDQQSYGNAYQPVAIAATGGDAWGSGGDAGGW